MQVMLWKPPGDVSDIMAGVEAAASKHNMQTQEPHLPVQVSDRPDTTQTSSQPSPNV